MNKKKVLIGVAIMGAALYMGSQDSEYQTGTGTLGSGLSGGGETGGGLSKEDETPENITESLKNVFDIFPSNTTNDSVISDKKYSVAQDYTGSNKTFIDSVISPSITDIPGIPVSPNVIYTGGKKSGTGFATIKRPSTTIPGTSSGYSVGTDPVSPAARGGGGGGGTGHVSTKKSTKTKHKPGTDVHGRSPIKNKKYKNR